MLLLPSFLPSHPSFLPSLYSLPSWWLSGEVGNISMKLSESRLADPHLETQVDLMRHEVRSDMQRLQDLISSSKTSLYSSSLERSFRDMWVFSCLLNWVVFVKENACMLKTIMKFTHKKQKIRNAHPLPIHSKKKRDVCCRTKRVISWILASCQGHMVTLGRKSRLCEGNAHDPSKLLLLVHPFLCFL